MTDVTLKGQGGGMLNGFTDLVSKSKRITDFDDKLRGFVDSKIQRIGPDLVRSFGICSVLKFASLCILNNVWITDPWLAWDFVYFCFLARLVQPLIESH